MTKRQSIDVHADLAAPVETVWSLLADATTWSDWAGFGEATYEEEGSPDPHGVGAVRRFRAGGLRSRERVLAFTPPTHLAYDYRGPVPMRGYRADVTLTSNEDGTRVSWHSEFTPTIPGTGAVLGAFLTSVLRRILSRLDRATTTRRAS